MHEIIDGKETVTVTPSFKPVEEYLLKQGRFKHLAPEEIKKIQDLVDKEWKR